ncbi:MAG: FAD-binding domain-containing protein [Bdellovibrionales bacterium]
MILLIENNFNEAIQWAKEHQPKKIYFSPRAQSNAQKSFLNSRFLEIKKLIPNIEVITKNQALVHFKSDSPLAYSALPAPEELKTLKMNPSNFLLQQNRFWQSVDFSRGGSFSKFRNKMEKNLPAYFEDEEQYTDTELEEKLNEYFSVSTYAKNYFDTRNEMIGANYSTQFSSWLACGSLNVRYLFNRLKDFEEEYGSNKSTYWILFELLWREYFYHSGYHHQEALFSKNGIQGASLEFSKFEMEEKKLEKVFSHTPFMKAAYNELRLSGYQSNRTRQLFASFFVNELGIDWRIGAQLFEKYLIDYDVFSNWGNWQYLAGVGHDPRGKRKFNLQNQLERYNPDGDYISYWFNKT